MKRSFAIFRVFGNKAHRYCLLLAIIVVFCNSAIADIPLYWWRTDEWTAQEGTNFGDELSVAVGKNYWRPVKREKKVRV